MSNNPTDEKNNNNKDNKDNNDEELDRSLSPIYQVYSDLGEIDPYSVRTEEDEENYYKSLLYGCKNCDLIRENKMFMVVHNCSRNGKSKYEQHEMESFNRKIERLKLGKE